MHHGVKPRDVLLALEQTHLAQLLEGTFRANAIKCINKWRMEIVEGTIYILLPLNIERVCYEVLLSLHYRVCTEL